MDALKQCPRLEQRIALLRPGWRGRFRVFVRDEAGIAAWEEFDGTVVDEPVVARDRRSGAIIDATICIAAPDGHHRAATMRTVSVSQIAELEPAP